MRKPLNRPGRFLVVGLAAFLALLALLAVAGAQAATTTATADEPTVTGFFGDHRIALGWQTNFQDPFSGVSLKKAIDPYSAFQVISQLQVDRQAYQISLGVRYLRDLGKKLFVHRYYGAGVGFATNYWKAYDPSGQDSGHTQAAAQVFIGIEVPWTFWQLVSALSSSAELSLGIEYDTLSGPRSRYGGSFGLHYWF